MDAEVVIVGAGPVGSTLALLLRRLGVRTLLLDRARFPRDKPCGEGLLPEGARVLAGLGVDLGAVGFPPLAGVRYRLPGAGEVVGSFAGPAFGVRRLRLDALLAERAEAETGVHVRGLASAAGGWALETSRGRLLTPTVVAADGLRSPLRRRLGWEGRPGPGSARYGLVGHLDVPGHDFAHVTVTLLDGLETYLAPTAPDELLVVVLGGRGRLRAPGRGVETSYLESVAAAHPELAGARLRGRVRGSGPFGVGALRVAAGGAFLCGDAAGFLDPLTGDGMAAGLAQAAVLAPLIAAGGGERPYQRWHAARWRRRLALGRIALLLTTSRPAALRALRGLGRRPAALGRLLEVAGGSRGLATLSPRDWAALAGR
jgi:flavin-dependent dehydrogenase